MKIDTARILKSITNVKYYWKKTTKNRAFDILKMHIHLYTFVYV